MDRAEFDYSHIVYSGWPLTQRVTRHLLVVLFRLLVRLSVEGLENLPAGGAYILAANHLHALDPAIGLLLVPRRVVGVAKEKWNRPPYRWLLRAMSDVVFIGRSNRRAFDAMRAELATGGVVAILPEGTRSPTRAMVAGQRGVAVLAAHSQVPVVPAGAWGQELAASSWKGARRVPVRVRIGRPVPPPPAGADKRELAQYTDELMLAIAALLPEPYRGVYGRRKTSSA